MCESDTKDFLSDSQITSDHKDNNKKTNTSFTRFKCYSKDKKNEAIIDKKKIRECNWVLNINWKEEDKAPPRISHCIANVAKEWGRASKDNAKGGRSNGNVYDNDKDKRE